MEECPYCLLDEQLNHPLWHSWYKQGPQQTLNQALLLGLPADVSKLRNHFNTHRSPQPEPKNISQQQAEAIVRRMRERTRLIMDAAHNNRGLSSHLIAASLYWTGGNKKAAHKNAITAMRSLLKHDMLYRLYPEQLPGPVMDTLAEPAYFLGYNSRYYIESRFGSKPALGEYLRDPVRQAPSREWLRRWQIAMQIPTALFYQLPQRLELGRRGSTEGSQRVELDVRDVYDRRFAELRFDDPLSEYKQIRAGGLLALRWADQSSGALIPCFYYRDHGAKKIERLLTELRGHIGLSRSRYLKKYLGANSGGYPLVMIVVDRPQRMSELLAESRASSLSGAELPMLAIEYSSLQSSSVWDEVWQPLFVSHGRVSLADALRRLAPQFSDGRNLLISK